MYSSENLTLPFIHSFLFQESPFHTPNKFINTNSIFPFVQQYPDFHNFVPQYVPQYPTRENEIPPFRPHQPSSPPVFHGHNDDNVPDITRGVATEQDDMNGVSNDGNRVDRRNIPGEDEPVDKSVEFIYNHNNYNPYFV